MTCSPSCKKDKKWSTWTTWLTKTNYRTWFAISWNKKLQRESYNRRISRNSCIGTSKTACINREWSIKEIWKHFSSGEMRRSTWTTWWTKVNWWNSFVSSKSKRGRKEWWSKKHLRSFCTDTDRPVCMKKEWLIKTSWWSFWWRRPSPNIERTTKAAPISSEIIGKKT